MKTPAYLWSIFRDPSTYVGYCVGPQYENDYENQGFMYEQLVAQMFELDEREDAEEVLDLFPPEEKKP